MIGFPFESTSLPNFCLNLYKISFEVVKEWGYSRIVTVEAAKKTQIITLHNNGCREQEGKGNGLRVQAETVPQGKSVFAIVGRARSRLLNLVEAHLGVRVDVLNLSHVVLW